MRCTKLENTEISGTQQLAPGDLKAVFEYKGTMRLPDSDPPTPSMHPRLVGSTE